MRRKPGALVPLETAVCEAAWALRRRGADEFHGYQIAKAISEAADSRLLTAYGTLYRALARLESMGLLQSRWEDPMSAADAGRPRRRLYMLTGAGEQAAVEAQRRERRSARRRRDGLAPA